MAHNTLNKLRERAPASLEVVRGIIAAVELGISEADRRIYVGGYGLTFGDGLAVSIGHWNAPPRSLETPSEPHRTTTASLRGHIIGGRNDPSLLYDIRGRSAGFEPGTPIILPGEQAPAEGPFINCATVEVAGEPSRDTNLLFADGELDNLNPIVIMRRLERFQVLVGAALTSAEAG